MDRVVQESIRMILEAIYAPWFEKRNRALGFRPNKGVKDAMLAITDAKYTTGLHTAIEGDISAAYDKVNKEKLIQILEKRIKDKKFINLIRDRLDYNYFDMESREHVKPSEGIPQGGIDSPYLFNIYMMEFDEYVHNELQEHLDELNKKITDSKRPPYIKFGQNLKSSRDAKKRRIKKFNKKCASPAGKSLYQSLLHQEIRQLRLKNHRFRKNENYQSNKRLLRLFYTRYADDWIILTNADSQVTQVMKEKIGKWLTEELSASLSDQKTLITDMRKKRSRFLGCELSINKSRVQRVKGINRVTLQKVGGQIIKLHVERQRYIDRLYMKGFCTKDGIPRELGWLVPLEAPVIIERYNAILRGMVNDKAGLVPFHELSRWIYILRYSCIKTLAQKYSTRLGPLHKKYEVMKNGLKTVGFTVSIRFRGEVWKKDWYLLTYRCLKKSTSGLAHD